MRGVALPTKSATESSFREDNTLPSPVSTKLIGNFKNGGAVWQPKGTPREVYAYDFPSLAEGRANPYGVYDVKSSEAWGNVGVDKDTSEFVIESFAKRGYITRITRHPTHNWVY